MSITGNGTLELDGNNEGGGGGSSLTIGGTLTNSSSNGSALSIGNGNITSADTLTVNGSGGLTNTGQIDIEGSATVQATLNVANAAAGFGTAGTETGNVYMQGDALLEFKSGEISTIDGATATQRRERCIADAGSTSSNSALTGLTTVAGNFWLQNGATVSPTGNVSITGNGTLELDGNNEDGAGGSSLTIGGTLTNSSTNGSALSIGNSNITSADTLTVNGSGGLTNTGQIDIEGSATVQATLNVANAAAGFGTAGTETGNVYPARRRAARVQERRDLDHRRRAASQRRERVHRRRRLDRQQQRADGADDGRRKFLAAERRNRQARPAM